MKTGFAYIAMTYMASNSWYQHSTVPTHQKQGLVAREMGRHSVDIMLVGHSKMLFLSGDALAIIRCTVIWLWCLHTPQQGAVEVGSGWLGELL